VVAFQLITLSPQSLTGLDWDKMTNSHYLLSFPGAEGEWLVGKSNLNQILVFDHVSLWFINRHREVGRYWWSDS